MPTTTPKTLQPDPPRSDLASVRDMLAPLLPRMPRLAELKGYNIAALRADMLAAVTVASVAIPQAMAYAVIAGLHPRYGLYAAMLPVAVAAIWGSSRFLTAGPTNAIAMILASTLAQVSVGGVLLASQPPEAQLACVFGLALLAGLLQVVMGLARLGELANFISHAVMVGFTGGAALLIMAGQLKNILGLSGVGGGGFFTTLAGVARHVHETHFWSLGFALMTMAVLLGCRRLSRRVPAALCALALASLAAFALDAAAHGVRLAGEVPRQLPPLSLPPAPDLAAIRDLFLPALAIALLGAVESLTIGKNLAAGVREPFDGNRELVGQGLGNVAAGLTSGIPGCASFTRSVLNFTAGGRTRLTTILSGVLVLPTIWLLAPAAAYIPLPSLAAVLLVMAAGMLDLAGARLCLKATRIDRAVLVATFAAALLLDLEQAVLMGVLLSLTLFLYKSAHPRVWRMTSADAALAAFPRIAGVECLAVYRIEGTLFFGAIQELERHLHDEERTGAAAVVLHLGAVFWVDASGVDVLERFAERCHARGVPLVVVVNEAVRQILRRTGVLDTFGEEFVAPTLERGLHTASALLRRGACRQCPRKGACPLATGGTGEGEANTA